MLIAGVYTKAATSVITNHQQQTSLVALHAGLGGLRRTLQRKKI